jgi:hypothetical protein
VFQIKNTNSKCHATAGDLEELQQMLHVHARVSAVDQRVRIETSAIERANAISYTLACENEMAHDQSEMLE